MLYTILSQGNSEWPQSKVSGEQWSALQIAAEDAACSAPIAAEAASPCGARLQFPALACLNAPLADSARPRKQTLQHKSTGLPFLPGSRSLILNCQHDPAAVLREYELPQGDP